MIAKAVSRIEARQPRDGSCSHYPGLQLLRPINGIKDQVSTNASDNLLDGPNLVDSKSTVPVTRTATSGHRRVYYNSLDHLLFF